MAPTGTNISGFPTETSKYVLAIQLTMMETKWHVRAECWGTQLRLSGLVVAHKYRVDETFLLSQAQIGTDYISQGLQSQPITCRINPNRMQNSLLILTSCLFISFNTQDVTFRCAAAVSRSDTGSSDVNTGLRSELPKQKLGRKPLKKRWDVRHKDLWHPNIGNKWRYVEDSTWTQNKVCLWLWYHQLLQIWPTGRATELLSPIFGCPKISPWHLPLFWLCQSLNPLMGKAKKKDLSV